MQHLSKKQKLFLPEHKPHDYSIIPLHVLYCENRPRSIFTYLIDPCETFTVHAGAFFVSGVDGHNILIDSGPTKEDFLKVVGACTEINPMAEVLKEKTGLDPDDIDLILLTHVHHDHCANIKEFKNAKVVVQKDEYDALLNPPEVYKGSFVSEHLDDADIVIVDGDLLDFLPGIHLLYTPGHTPGGQSIVIDSDEGRIIVCSLCCDEANFCPREDLKNEWSAILIPGLLVNSQDAYESTRRIKDKADYIITLHDERSFSRGACPGKNWPRYS